MAWNAPKTNWTADDYVNASHVAVWVADINYLHDEIIAAGGTFALGWTSLNNIVTGYDTYLYANDYMNIEWDIWRCAKAIKDTLGCSTNYFPSYRGWADNNSAPDYQRLNKIGEALINIYNYLQSL